MKFRQARFDDIERILAITDSAREYQRALGFVQWEDGYPDRSVIENDIGNGDAYVLENDGIPVCYAVLADKDADYDLLSGIWEFDGKYGVVHRIAIAPEMRGQHLTDILFPLIENEFQNRNINIVRIDTGEENIVMRGLMDKFGYGNRGVHLFTWGRRMVFEKRI